VLGSSLWCITQMAVSWLLKLSSWHCFLKFLMIIYFTFLFINNINTT
jgi:hypothetical protein